MNKIVVVGIGYVGKAYVYSLINQKLCDEIVLIDSDKDVLEANYIDFKDSAVFSNIKITLGDYSDCNNANLVVITAGHNQAKNETRLELLSKNSEIIKSITENVMNNNFNGIFLVATNPVDVCTYLVQKYSGYDSKKVIGSGTELDTVRLKRILSEKLDENLENIDTYVLGEHGDSSFPVWSKTKINNKNITELLSENELSNVENDVRNVAYEIINKKGETSFGIGNVLAYLTDIIINDKNENVIVSKVNNDYSISNVYKLNKDGLSDISFDLNEEENIKYNKSIDIIKKAIDSLED